MVYKIKKGEDMLIKMSLLLRNDDVHHSEFVEMGEVVEAGVLRLGGRRKELGPTAAFCFGPA